MNIKEILNIEKNIAPEIVEIITKRYNIIKIIEMNQPIGRRSLSVKYGTTERIMRAEADKLKNLGLLNIETSGMSLTQAGKDILKELDVIVFHLKGLSELENKLKYKLGLKDIAIVPGDVNKDIYAFKDLGNKAANIIIKLLSDSSIIGITGGTTMACIANEMKKIKVSNKLLVVPARGGLGEALEIQSNTIAANMADKLNAEYKLLHIPDNIDSKTLNALKNNKLIKEVLDIIGNIDLLIFGLGNAEDMALRRKINSQLMEEIKKKNLVAETFGYYFDNNGNVKMHTDSAGITIEKFKNIKNAICVAAGSNKAEAIYAFSKFYKDFILVTDESAARKILSI